MFNTETFVAAEVIKVMVHISAPHGGQLLTLTINASGPEGIRPEYGALGLCNRIAAELTNTEQI